MLKSKDRTAAPVYPKATAKMFGRLCMLALLLVTVVKADYISDQLLTSSQTVDLSSDVYWIDASGGSVTITIPDIANLGTTHNYFKRVDTSLFTTVTLSMSVGGQQINGAATLALTLLQPGCETLVDSYASGEMRLLSRI